MLLFLFSCSMSSPSTVVDELRVLAIQTEPAEIAPTETEAQLNLLVADPLEEGADIMVWSCTNLGEGCLEKDFYEGRFDDWIGVYRRESLLTELPLSIPSVLGGLLSEYPEESLPFQGSLIWVLACVPEQCPIIESVKQGYYDMEALSDPFSLLNDLPFDGVSLSFRSLNLSLRPEEERIQNPVMQPMFETPLSMPLGESQILDFSYSLNGVPTEDSLVYGYATAGSFSESDRRRTQLQEQAGAFSLEWFSSEEPQEGEVFIILENGLGGTGIWTSTASIE